MAKLILNAYSAEANGQFLSIAITSDSGFPSRMVEIKNVTDCVAAFEAYKAEAAASGKPLALSMRMGRGDRKPPGFNKIKAAHHYETVNI